MSRGAASSGSSEMIIRIDTHPHGDESFFDYFASEMRVTLRDLP